ncbi:conserved hypothetical protein [Burkholderia cenocepacia]|nr:conserved hypothetical protein [Burkholderia cenocepacia]
MLAIVYRSSKVKNAGSRSPLNT